MPVMVHRPKHPSTPIANDRARSKVLDGLVTSLKNQPLVVIDEPLHHLALLKLNCLGDSCRKVDVPLLTFAPFDYLHFRWISHI